MGPLPATLPSRFTVTCHADGKLAGSIPIGVTLHMWRGNDHFVVAGLTGARGKLVVTRDGLLREVNAARDLFPADYAPADGSDNQFAGRMTVAVLTTPEIEAAIKAHDLYRAVTPYPDHFREWLETGHDALTTLNPKRVEVAVSSPAGDHGVSFNASSIPYPATARPLALG